jgi:hypothetical protein
MSKAKRETTQAWISERMQAVLSSFPQEDVKATLPVILMFMVEAFGIDQLAPPIRAAVQRAFDEAGVRAGASEAEVADRMRRYVAGRAVNLDLLERIKEIFDTHYAALKEEKASGLSRFFGAPRAARPAVIGAPRPTGALSVAAFCAGPRRV